MAANIGLRLNGESRSALPGSAKGRRRSVDPPRPIVLNEFQLGPLVIDRFGLPYFRKKFDRNRTMMFTFIGHKQSVSPETVMTDHLFSVDLPSILDSFGVIVDLHQLNVTRLV